MPNVLVLMADEHNPFFSSVYGHPFVQTPNMERLAKMGTVFQNAYCPSPLCQPSRSAFMAGKRVHEIQVYNNCNLNLNPNYPSYGKVLSDNGVYTAYVGKTDVYATSDTLGFNEMIQPKDRSQPGDINFRRTPLAIRAGAADRSKFFGIKEGAFDMDIPKVGVAVEWIKNEVTTLNSPWTLTVNIAKPHFPHYVTEEFWDMYPEGEDLPEYGREEESANHPYARDLRDHFEADKFSEENQRGLRRGYYGCVTFADRQLGRLLDALEESGQLKDTVIIYTSDHGEMLGKFGIWWKCSLYEDSVRVPVLAAGPGFEPGKVVHTPVDLLDVQATLFKSTGVERPVDWVGTPLQEIPENDPKRIVFSEYHGHGAHSGAYLVRKGDWKLIYYMDGPNQLFNLADDPDELNNLYEEKSDKAAELEQELRAICSPEEENERAERFEKEQLKVLEQFSQA